jgi:hypothetical protein
VEAGLTWCRTSLWTRVFSGHRLGWCRYLVACGGPALWAALLAEVTSIPVSIGGPAVAGAVLGLLWWLPGARVGCGFGDDGVYSRRWLFTRFVPWSEVAMIELGLMYWDPLSFRGGGRVGVTALRVNGRQMDFRCLPWFRRWRDPTLEPLLAAARTHGVPVVLDPGAERWFRGVQADLVGDPWYDDGRWTT